MKKLILVWVFLAIAALVLFSGCLQGTGQVSLSNATKNCRLVPYEGVVASFSDGSIQPEPYTVQECSTVPREEAGITVLKMECREITKYRTDTVAEEQVSYLKETRYKEVCD